MASRQFEEERAEAAAKLAAKDAGDVSRERHEEEGTNVSSEKKFKEERAEAASKLAAKDLEDVNRERNQNTEQQKPGVIGSMIRAVQDTFEHAKEVVVGKSQDVGEKGAEVREISAEKSRGIYDAATEKAKETKDATKEKAGEYKDYAAQKAQETMDATIYKTPHERNRTNKGKTTMYRRAIYRD